MYQVDPPRPAAEVLPTMYDLPSEDLEEPGLPDEFHHNGQNKKANGPSRNINGLSKNGSGLIDWQPICERWGSTRIGFKSHLNAMCNVQSALIPQPLLPGGEKGSKRGSKSLSRSGRGI